MTDPKEGGIPAERLLAEKILKVTGNYIYPEREDFLAEIESLLAEEIKDLATERMPSLLKQARENAYDRAAEVADDYDSLKNPITKQIAERIRALKEGVCMGKAQPMQDEPSQPERCDCKDRDTHMPGYCPAGRLGKDKPDAAVGAKINEL